MHRRLRLPAVLLSLALALGPGAARGADAGGPVAAGRLATAQRLYGDLAYAKALAAYRHTLRARDISPPQRFQALLGEGWCLVILGQGRLARRALSKALAMNPGWSPPPDLSPKLAGAVRTARARLHLAPVTLALSAPPGTPGDVVVTVHDPGHRVRRVVLSVRLPGGAWQTPPLSPVGDGRFVATVHGGAGQAVDAAVSAENAAGFPIARDGRRDAPKMLALPGPAKAAAPPGGPGHERSGHPGRTRVATSTPAPPPPPVHSHRAPPASVAPAPSGGHPGHGLMLAGWITGGAGVAALAAGTAFEIVAQNEAALYNGDPAKLGSSSHAQQVGASAVAHAQLATGLFISGAVVAATGGILLLMGHGQAATAAGSPTLAVAPTPGGAVIVASGRLPF